jgi:uncharacterized protein YifE (UPF0438 family)
MSGGDRVLTSWDLALLDRHRRFYAALASGTKQPTTALQAHFVAVAFGHADPVTQHEVAFCRFRDGWRDPRSQRNVALAEPGVPAVVTPERVERSIDLADAAQLRTLESQGGRVFRRVGRLYIDGLATARRSSADAAVWVSTALADAHLARTLEQWTSEKFGGLCDIYTRALDGEFAKGLRAGDEYVSPWLHRLFDGHTPAAALQAARSALRDDTSCEEVVGCLRALGSDLVTVVGLPLVTFTPADFARLEAFVCDGLGVSREWLIDALHVNAVEGVQLVAGCVPLVAATMGWSERDAKTFAQLAGSLGVGAVAAASPLLVVVSLLMLARAYQLAKTGEARNLWRQTVEGGATSAAALSVAAGIAGPPLLGVAAGLVVAGGLRRALRGRSGIERSRWVEQPAARVAGAISILCERSGAGRAPVRL